MENPTKAHGSGAGNIQENKCWLEKSFLHVYPFVMGQGLPEGIEIHRKDGALKNLNCYEGAGMMKDRALRRHQEFKAKKRSIETYEVCIGNDVPKSELQDLELNVEKLRKVCILAQQQDGDPKRSVKKPLRELKHDISMKEQLLSD